MFLPACILTWSLCVWRNGLSRCVEDAQACSYTFFHQLPGSCIIAHVVSQEFGFLFRREACWSIAQPVPDFGGPYTPLKEVHAFYSFWRSFNSKYFCWHPDLKDLRLALTTNARRLASSHPQAASQPPSPDYLQQLHGQSCFFRMLVKGGMHNTFH